MRSIHSVAAAAILASAPCFAQIWLPIGQTEAGTMTLEVTSIRPQGNYWKAWAQWSSPKDETSTGYPLFTWRSYKELSYYDCKHGSVATKQLVYYDGENGAGNAVRTLSTPEGNLRFDDPIPGTLGDTLHRYVCRNRK